MLFFFFFKQKTAYEMRISDWSSDVCSSDLAKQDIRVLESSLSLYKLDNFNYPSTQQGLEALVAKPSGDPEPKNYKSGGYIQSLPKDPWGSPYQYLSPGSKGEIDIFSFGRGGKPGGGGLEADDRKGEGAGKGGKGGE